MLEPDEKTDLVGVVSLTPLNNFMLVKLGSPPSSATWAAGTPGGRTAQSGDGTNEGWSEGSFGVAVFLGGEMETEGEDLPVSFGLRDYKVRHFGSSLGTVK